MKQIKITLVALAFAFSANAQMTSSERGSSMGSSSLAHYEGDLVVGLDVGYSLIGGLLSTNINGTDVSTGATPVINVMVDYGLTDRVSLGLAGAYQGIFGEYSYSYLDAGSTTVTEDVRTDISRIHVALRPLFHYGNNDQLDLYSGLRIGVITNSVSHNSSDPDFAEINGFSGSRFTMGLVAFGMRYYFNDMVGFNFEVGLGVPQIVNGGVSLRF